MPESHSEKGLETLRQMGTTPEDWTFADIEWVKEKRLVPTKVSCPTCHHTGQANFRPSGELARPYEEVEPQPTFDYTNPEEERVCRARYQEWLERKRAYGKENVRGRCPTCPTRRNWPSYGTGEVDGVVEAEVMVGYIKWPKGTRFDSRFGCQWRGFRTAVCELCSKSVKSLRMVPVVSHTDPAHGMWVGADCARKFFDIKPLKKGHFLAERLGAE